MWTLKNKQFRNLSVEEIEQHNQNPQQSELPYNKAIELGRTFDLMAHFVLTDGTSDKDVTTFARDGKHAVETIQAKIDALNEMSDFITEANEPNWTLPEKAAPREKTDLEKKQELYEQERAELVKLKEDVELGIADENDVTNKANAVRNARTEFENARRNK